MDLRDSGAETPPFAPKAWAPSGSGPAQRAPLFLSPASSSLLPAPGLPSAPPNSTHAWIWAQVTTPKFIFPNPMPCCGHVSGKCKGMGGWRRSSQGHRGGQPSLASNPALPNYGLVAAKDLDGLGGAVLHGGEHGSPGQRPGLPL